MLQSIVREEKREKEKKGKVIEFTKYTRHVNISLKRTPVVG